MTPGPSGTGASPVAREEAPRVCLPGRGRGETTGSLCPLAAEREPHLHPPTQEAVQLGSPLRSVALLGTVSITDERAVRTRSVCGGNAPFSRVLRQDGSGLPSQARVCRTRPGPRRPPGT